MKRLMVSVLTLLTAAALFAAPAGFYDVRDYGAKGDGKNIDSHAINAAIEAASEAGGGTVYFPAGTYSSYSVRLKSDISLYLDRGAVLKAAVPTAEEAYDLPEPNDFSAYQDFGHSHWRNSLIWGIGLHDVAILGFGMIDGTEGITREQARMNGFPAADKAVALKECRNVTIKDVTVLMGGHFAFLLTGVDNLTIDNVRVDSNRDGFDIDCCANVRMSNCLVNTVNDDAIVLKSSYGLGYAKATENVVITNCQVSGYDPGTLLDGTFRKTVTSVPDRDGPCGRIKFGTESNGGFKNITISNCVFDNCRGIALETVDGGVLEDVTINNIAMRDLKNSPIYIRLGNRARGPEGLPVSVVRRVKISDMVVKNADSRYASLVFGIEGHQIEDVTLSNIHIQYKGGLTMDDVTGQKGSNSFFATEKSSDVTDPFAVPQQEKGYPEPSSHGIIPAYGLFIAHARNVSIDNVEMELIDADRRPAVVIMDAEDVKFTDVKADKPTDAPWFVLKNVKNFEVRNFAGVKDRKVASAGDARISD